MLLFPQWVILTRFGRYVISGYASRSTSEMRLDHVCGLQARSTNRLSRMISSTYRIFEHFMLKAAKVQTMQTINECFGVGVMSEPGMAERRS